MEWARYYWELVRDADQLEREGLTIAAKILRAEAEALRREIRNRKAA